MKTLKQEFNSHGSGVNGDLRSREQALSAEDIRHRIEKSRGWAAPRCGRARGKPRPGTAGRVSASKRPMRRVEPEPLRVQRTGLSGATKVGKQASKQASKPAYPLSYNGAGEGMAPAPPSNPPARRAPVAVTLGGAAPFPPRRCGVMPERRTAVVTARVSATEFADWRAKAAAAGVPLSALIRRAMARTRTWTARAAEVERERTREVGRIGNNLNQIARWANTHKGSAEAVEVIARLVAIERALGALARFERPERNAH